MSPVDGEEESLSCVLAGALFVSGTAVVAGGSEVTGGSVVAACGSVVTT